MPSLKLGVEEETRMPSFAELSTWTNPDIVVKIRELLPSGWTFDYRFDPGGSFSGEIVEPCDPDRRLTMWHDVQADERLLLLNAYGWLYVRKPTARHPAWVRGVTPVVSGQPLPKVIRPDDPEDLNPEEIASVYGDDEAK